jgi:transposase-like protein
MTETRAPAQYCPYCGETNLWPHEDSHGAWSCHDCLRVFAVRFIGIAGRGAASSGTAPGVTAGSAESVVSS